MINHTTNKKTTTALPDAMVVNFPPPSLNPQIRSNITSYKMAIFARSKML
jgi:hypothetical protein